MAVIGYEKDCIDAAAAFTRFMNELRAQGHGFNLSDAELAEAIDNALGGNSDFEATFYMVSRGLALASEYERQRENAA